MLLTKIALACLITLGSGASARPREVRQSSDSCEDVNVSDITDPKDPCWMWERPVYSHEYQVSDDDTQTYITHSEERDGSVVTGQYSYVDNEGSLIKVVYQADGANGYTEQRTIQENFIIIRAKPVVTEDSTVVITDAPAVAPPPVNSNNDLVATIIAALQPSIKQTISTSLGSRSNGQTGQTFVQPAQRVRTVSVPKSPSSSTGSSSIFGAGRANRIVAQPVQRVQTISVPKSASSSTGSRRIFGADGANRVVAQPLQKAQTASAPASPSPSRSVSSIFGPDFNLIRIKK